MSRSARPFFVVSSGRSGTKMMEKLFEAYPQVDIHHEYMVHHLQPVAVKYQMGLASANAVKRTLLETYGAAIHYSKAEFWGDASNKLSWIVEVLAETFPDARFVHLIRDGRKVASSYFHKLGAECYDDMSTEIFSDWVESYPHKMAPPPEKPYWWPQPPTGSPQRREFVRWSQFERIAYHWSLCHQRIAEQLALIPQERQIFLRLEDLTRESSEVGRLLGFLELPSKAEISQTLSRPHNVNRPQDTLLTPEQTEAFWRIAGETMAQFGYEHREEYVVNY